MIDRRQVLLGSLAGLIVPAAVGAQPPPAAPPPQPQPAGGNTGTPVGASGGQASRLGQRNQRESGVEQRQDQAQQPPQPPRIHALVLSQSYRARPDLALANTSRDGQLMARSFMGLQFDLVTVHEDGTPAETTERIATYLRTIDSNTIALMYLAGHGIEIDGENLLLLEDGQSFLSLRALVQLLQQRAGVTILFLDACRNNPLGGAAPVAGRQVARTVQADGIVQIQTVGLSELRADPSATLGRLHAFSLQGSQIKIVFSTDPANVALDGARPNSRNSPFAAALARNIRQQISLDDIVALTTGDVLRATRRQQSPWSQGSIDRPIFLSGRRRREQPRYG